MTNSIKDSQITIDAKGRVLGRLATEIADTLRGKSNPSFRYNTVSGVKVLITNGAKIKVTGNKMEDKFYYRHSGYLGNLKTTALKDAMKNPDFVIRHAVAGMLPKNKLQKRFLNNLTIIEGEE